MSERPILFSGPMVCALLDGRKTQTRRVVKPQPSDYTPATVAPQRLRGEPPKHPAPYFDAYNGGPHWCWWDEYDRQGADWIKCPYGKPGDVLWVKETHRLPAEYDHLKPTLVRDGVPVWYMADGGADEGWGKTRVSLHMQRRFSRLALRITDVRVERLNDCSREDAAAEGLVKLPASGRYVVEKGEQYAGLASFDPRDTYARLWDQINGPGSWAANPWVWAVSFERVQP